MKNSKNISSSGELSESAGLNDFLNAPHTNETKYLPSFQGVKSNLIPNHTYGLQKSKAVDMIYGYPSGGLTNSDSGGSGGSQSYDYYNPNLINDDGEIEEEFNDPYDFEVDLTSKKKTDKSSTVSKFEERKKALQKKREEKEIKRKEQEEKEKKEAELKKKKITQKFSPKKPVNFSVKDVFDKNNTSISPRKGNQTESDDDISDPKPIIYDPGTTSEYNKLLEDYKELVGSQKFLEDKQKILSSPKILLKTEEDEKSEDKLNKKSMDSVGESPEIKQDFYDPNVMENYLKKQRDSLENKAIDTEKIQKYELNSEFERANNDQSISIENNQNSERNSNLLNNNQKPLNENQNIKKNLTNNTLDNYLKFDKNPIFQETEIQYHQKDNNFLNIQNSSTQNPNQTDKNIIEKPLITNETQNNFNKIENPIIQISTSLRLKELEQLNNDLNQKNLIYQNELEQILQENDLLKFKIQQYESEITNLKSQNEKKILLLQEKQDFFKKISENRLISESQQQNEHIQTMLKLEIQKLNEELILTKNMISKNDKDNNSQNIEKFNLENQLKDLKKQIIELDLQFKTRQNLLKRENQNLNEDYNDFHKEFGFQELLLKGFQKENEKLMIENRLQSEKILNLTNELYKETQNSSELRLKLAKENGQFFSKNEIDLNEQNFLGKDRLVSINETEKFKNQNLILVKELDNINNRINEKDNEIERLKKEIINKNGPEIESLLGKLKEKDSYINDLKEKINFYSKNNDDLNNLKSEIENKNSKIQEFENQIKSILNDPESNLDLKSKHFQQNIIKEQKKVKFLEKEIKNLEEELSKKQPSLIQKRKETKEENEIISDLKKNLLQKEKLLKQKEESYENTITELRKELDRIKLLYQKNDNKNKIIKSNKKSNKKSKNNDKIDINSDITDLVVALKTKNEHLQQIINSNNESKSITIPKILNFYNYQMAQDFQRLWLEVEKVKKDIENRNKNIEIANNFYRELEGLENNDFSNKIRLKLNNLENYFKKNSENDSENTWILCEIEIDSILNEISNFIEHFILDSPRKPLKINNYIENNTTKNIIGKDDENVNLLKENKRLKESLNDYMQIFENLNSEKENLRNLISNIGRNPNKTDFCILEKKLELLEKNYIEKEIEINYSLKAIGGDNSKEIKILKEINERQKKEFYNVILKKNKEIDEFKKELAELINEIELIKKKK